MKINTFRCFGSRSNTGNLATIINGAEELSVAERLRLTQEKQYHASVFTNYINDTTISVDFYYPHMRSPLCLHATLAVAHQYFQNKTSQTTVTLITQSKQEITAHKQADKIWLQLETKPFPEINIDPQTTQSFFNNTNNHAILNIITSYVNSVGSPKLFVELGNVKQLNTLEPNLLRIHEWSQINKISGCYVYVKIDTNIIFGRNFNHLDSKLEDCATGVAAGALTTSLQCDLVVHQGGILHNPCIINTRYNKHYVSINGNVEELT